MWGGAHRFAARRPRPRCRLTAALSGAAPGQSQLLAAGPIRLAQHEGSTSPSTLPPPTSWKQQSSGRSSPPPPTPRRPPPPPTISSRSPPGRPHGRQPRPETLTTQLARDTLTKRQARARVEKPIYGIQQAGRRLQRMLFTWLREHGFIPLDDSDPCVFSRRRAWPRGF